MGVFADIKAQPPINYDFNAKIYERCMGTAIFSPHPISLKTQLAENGYLVTFRIHITL
jgi:hypothetical protein